MDALDELFPPAVTTDTVATDIPHRSPRFKVHSKPGLAHNALGKRGFNSAFAKYELENGVWVRTYAYIPPDQCKRCGNDYQRSYNRYHHDPREDDLPKYRRTPVCKDCVSEIRAEIEQAEADMEYREKHERYFLNN